MNDAVPPAAAGPRPLAALQCLSGDVRAGLIIVLPIVFLGVLVPLLSPYDPTSTAGAPLVPPGATNLFGTDDLGRDVFTRTFTATRVDATLALIGVAVPLIVGTLLGGLLGTTRSAAVNAVWMTVIDGINAFPAIVLVIAIVAIVGPGVQGILIGLILTNWARYARIARTRSLTLREADFIHATDVLGYSRGRVLLRHIFPNVYTETLAYGVSDFTLVIITVAGLSFFGIGVQPPAPEWGAMMASGRLLLQQAWWITVAPGLALSLTAVGVGLLAEGIVRQVRGET